MIGRLECRGIGRKIGSGRVEGWNAEESAGRLEGWKFVEC